MGTIDLFEKDKMKKLNDDVKLFNLFNHSNNYSKRKSDDNKNKTVMLFPKTDYMIFFNKGIKFDKLPAFFSKYSINISVDCGKDESIGIKSKDFNEGINSEFVVTEEKYKDYLTNLENELKTEDPDSAEILKEDLEKKKNYDSYFLIKPSNELQLKYLMILALYILENSGSVLIYDTYNGLYYDKDNLNSIVTNNNII